MGNGLKYLQFDLPDDYAQRGAEWMQRRLVELCMTWHRRFNEAVVPDGGYLIQHGAPMHWVRFTKAESKNVARDAVALFPNVRHFPDDLLLIAYNLYKEQQTREAEYEAWRHQYDRL
jgi:hypothetical protein